GLAHLGPHARCLRFAVWLPVQLQTPRKTRFRLAVLHLGRSGFSPAGRYDWFRCYITSSNPRLCLAQVRLRLIELLVAPPVAPGGRQCATEGSRTRGCTRHTSLCLAACDQDQHSSKPPGPITLTFPERVAGSWPHGKPRGQGRSTSRTRRAMTRRFAEQLQCPAQAVLERPLSAGAGPHAVNRFLRLVRAKPKPSKCLEHPRPQVRRLRTRRFAVARAIAMLKAKPRGQVAVSDEPALVNSPVVRGAQEHKVRRAMIDAFGAWAEMMDVTVAISAPRNDAAPVAPPDQTPHLGRNVLCGTRRFTPMGAEI